MKTPHSRTRRRAAAALALLIALAAPARAQQQPQPKPTQGAPARWEEFRSGAGLFRVKLPSPPKVGKKSFTKGPLTFERHTHESWHGEAYNFQVEYMDLPAGLDDPELTLEGGIAGLAQFMTAEGARVLTRGKVMSGPCEGRELTLELPPKGHERGGFAQGRTFRSGQRIYVLFFIGLADMAQAREVGRTFVESFAVEDGCRAPVAPVAAPSAPPTRRRVAGKPDPATGWRLIESVEHGFVALMPGEVQLESRLAQVEPLPLHHHEYAFEAEEGFYSAEVIGDYPPDFFTNPTSLGAMGEVMLLTLRRNLEPAGFTLNPRRKLKVGAFPGDEYELAHSQLPGEGRAQVFITPRRIYIFAAFAKAPAVERFFSSIRITPN